MRAGDFFKTLANESGSGPAMIRYLASLAPYKDKLLLAYREGRFTNSMPKAVQDGKPGWRVLGYAVISAEQLVHWYSHETESFIAQWFCDCISEKQWDGKWEGLVKVMNSSIAESLDKPNVLDRVSGLRDFANTFVLVPERHLPGVGPEMLSFFLRDWRDFAGWCYYWKHDTRNEAFWSMVANSSRFGLKDGQKDTVLAFLIDNHNLSGNELKTGALAKINTAVYRIHRDWTTTGIEQSLSSLGRSYDFAN